MYKEFIYDIDIIGSCNLRCPSCPVGNFDSKDRFKGLMDVNLFEEIIKKAKRETPEISFVVLFNWAEPLLHPKLPEFVKILNKYEISSVISTNLNKSDNLSEIIKSEPTRLIISLSGFYQDTYSRTHVKGNIETVKSNMFKIREIMDILDSKMEVSISYHKYLHNMEDDYERMSSLCKELGFIFMPYLASLLPLEKLLDYYENKNRLSTQDIEIINLMIINPDEYRDKLIEFRDKECSLRTNHMVINADASVALCSASYYTNIADNFLDVPYSELQKRKFASDTCVKCIRNAIHLTYSFIGKEDLSYFGKK